jgi:hypothetical protein
MARKPRPAPAGVAAAAARAFGSSKAEAISAGFLEGEAWRAFSQQQVGLRRGQERANADRRTAKAARCAECKAKAAELRAQHPKWLPGDITNEVTRQTGLAKRTVRRYLKNQLVGLAN